MLNLFFSPLEQFEIFPWFVLPIVFTQANVYLIIIFFTLIIFLSSSVYSANLVPTYYQYLVELLYKFIINTVKQQIGLRGFTYFPIFFLIFFFIATTNLLGLVPFSFTLTSQVVLTFLIALSFNLGLILLGFYIHNFRFFNLFIPHGAPLVLIPLIVVIELVSYLLRTFSLSIRLAANMMAGHTLLHILSTFVLMFLQNYYFFFIALFPGLLVFLAMGLELGIAVLQAYVFFILLTLYLNDSLTLGGH